MRTTTFFLAAIPTTVYATVDILDIQTLLQHDTTSPAYSPWSFPPYCIDTTGTQYCVYTSNSTSPYGQSLITTPHNVHLASTNLNFDPIPSFLTLQQAKTLYSNPPSWEVVDIPGKDKGVVATRKIEKYETIMIDQAALVVDLDVEADFLSKEGGIKEYRALLKVAVEKLGGKEVVREMSGRHGASGDENEEEINDDDDEGVHEHNVLRTNAFGSTVAGWRAHTLFPLISRINHACDPNSYVLFSRAGVSMAIRAYRDIEEGEEISISYLPLGLPSSSRAPQIARWGFKCSCHLCSLSTTERKISDTRRALITQAESRILHLAAQHPNNPSAIPSAIDLALETIDLIKDEGLHSQLTDVYTMLAMLYLERKEVQLAEAYGEMAWNVLEKHGYLGAEGETGAFSLRELMGRIEGMGGIGAVWRRKAWGHEGLRRHG